MKITPKYKIGQLIEMRSSEVLVFRVWEILTATCEAGTQISYKGRVYQGLPMTIETRIQRVVTNLIEIKEFELGKVIEEPKEK